MSGFKGGCLCGAITYEVSSAPIDVWNCHCDDCRKVTGASFSTNVIVKFEDLTVTKGTPSTYPRSGDNGNIKTYNFCPECGSLLFSNNSGRPEIGVVRVGSIDDASFVRASGNLYCSRALPCSHLAADLDNFDTMPTPEEMAERLRK
jgi:hypothetical protein